VPAFVDGAQNHVEKSQDRIFIPLTQQILLKNEGDDYLPPRETDTEKRKRQYKHIKESELKRGASLEDAERIAAATVNKIRKEKGEVES